VLRDAELKPNSNLN